MANPDSRSSRREHIIRDLPSIMLAPLILASCRDRITNCPSAPELNPKYQRVLEAASDAQYKHGPKKDAIEVFAGIDIPHAIRCYVATYQAGRVPSIKYGCDKNTLISREEAAARHAQNVAHNIVLDQREELPWSLSDLNDDELKALFNADFYSVRKKHFRNPRLYVPQHIPADPEKTYEFLKRHELIKEDHRKTILAVIDWYRSATLHHNRASDAKCIQMYGHCNPPTTTDLLKQHSNRQPIYINGCQGTARFIKDMLSTIGIPVKVGYIILQQIMYGQLVSVTHARVVFPTIGMSTLHADDLYGNIHKKSQHLRDNGLLAEIPTRELLVVDDGFERNKQTYVNDKIEENIKRYMPDGALLYRITRRKYGQPTEMFPPGIDDKKALELDAIMDAEIDKIGGGNLRLAEEILKKRVIIPPGY